MLSTLKAGEGFVIGAESVRAVVTAKESGRLTIEIQIPHTPEVCGRCGSGAGLSRNLAGGEIVCMMSGCGHKHGFSPKVVVVDETATRIDY